MIIIIGLVILIAAVVAGVDAAGAAGTVQRPSQKMHVAMRVSAAGSAFRWRNTTLVVPGNEKLRILPTARYFSGLTAAGVRSNIFDITLLYPHT